MKNNKKDQIEIEKVEYYPDAEVVCSCGAKFNIGSTKKKISVEVCSSCHPYYTGTQKLVDTSGRVDKFKERLAKRNEMLAKTSKTKKETSKKDTDKKGKENK